MVVPGAGFRGVTLCDVITFIKITICLKAGEDQKKRFSPKIEWVFGPKVKTKKKSSLEIECVLGPNK